MLQSQPLLLLGHALQFFTDASNKGWGPHLGDSTARGVWSDTESRLYISFSGPQAFQASLQGSDCVSSNRQHTCGVLHQQGRRFEIRLSLCPPLEASVLVPHQGNSPEGKTNSRSLECNSRQILHTQTSDTDGVVPFSAGV